MRKKLMTIALAGALAFGGAATVAQADPGPHHGNNKKGLCTAYFNGQKKGHNKDGKESPKPFAALEAEAAEDEMSIFDWCGGAEGIGGNPGENGRFTECFDTDENTGNDACPAEEEE